MTYMLHQIDRLKQEMEKNVAENNEFKNLSQKNVAEEWIQKGERSRYTLWKIYHSWKRKPIF